MPSTESKAELRSKALAARDALAPGVRAAAAEAIAERVLPVAAVRDRIVSGFMPIGSEINPIPLMKRLAGEGAKLALPVVVRRGEKLLMRSWAFGKPLIESGWKIKVPAPEAPQVDPDILIIPLAAFDRGGQRIGYGAGYYDRTIADLRARKTIVAIGIAFAVQEVAAVPATRFDQPLDFVMTEAETIAIHNQSRDPLA